MQSIINPHLERILKEQENRAQVLQQLEIEKRKKADSLKAVVY